MAEIPIPKINYNDYYKFKISSGIIAGLICLMATTIITFYAFIASNHLVYAGALVYIIFTFLCVISVFDAMRKWKKKQELIDTKELAEVAIRLCEIRKKYGKELVEISDESELFKELVRKIMSPQTELYHLKKLILERKKERLELIKKTPKSQRNIELKKFFDELDAELEDWK